MRYRDTRKQMFWKKMAPIYKLPCRIVTKLQFVKNTVSVKYNKVKYNKMRYTCIYVFSAKFI